MNGEKIKCESFGSFNARRTHTCVTESLLGFQEDNRNDGTRKNG